MARRAARYDILCSEIILLHKEILRTDLTEAVLDADALHRNRILCARQVGNGRAETGADLMVLRCDDAAGLCSRTEHQLLVKRLPGVHVDHASGNTLCCQHFFGLECLVYQNTGGNNGHVLAVTQRNALADLKIRAIRVNRW